MLGLALRSLRHYRRSAIAVAAGIALATAVMTGSLLVGDSVILSLRERALARLGKALWALTTPGVFRAELAREVTEAPSLRSHRVVAAALIVQTGSARNAATDAVVPGVSVLGVDGGFARFAPVSAPPPGHAVASQALARDLALRTGDDLLVTIGRPQNAPGAGLFTQTAFSETTRTARLTVDRVVPDSAGGGFSLEPGLSVPRSVFVDREWLAETLGRAGMANAIVLDGGSSEDFGPHLAEALRASCRIEDTGLSIAPQKGGWLVRSARLTLPESQATAAEEAAHDVGARASRTSVFLATTLRDRRTGRSAAYAVVAAVGTPSGQTAVPSGEAAMNAWAAEDLGARPGDTIGIDVLEPAADGSYTTRSRSVRLARVLPMQGPGADSALPPVFAGISDAARMGDWNPPFPVDRSRVTLRDERYWEQYRAAPRLYLHLDALRSMWQSGPLGQGADWVTGVRVVAPPGGGVEAYRQALTRRLDPADAGLVFKPVRRQALEAAQGSTEFGGLFLGMGMFLVAAGAWMAGALMRLMAERRASQAGLMLACGFTPAETVRLAAAEGAILSAAGAPVGGLLGVAYGAGICHGLATWWSGAIGGESFRFHLSLPSLAIGVVSGLIVGLLSTVLGARTLPRLPILQLLAGSTALGASGERRRGRPALLLAGLLLAAVGLAAACAAGAAPATAGFFGIGALLLVAALPACDLALIAARRRRPPAPTFLLLALRNASVQRGHSLLAFGLTACAAFVLVTVAANVRDFSRFDVRQRSSGAGGYSLIATTTLPVPYDIGTATGRARLGFSPDDEPLLSQSTVVSFLLSPGDDASCLNPARPVAPRLLGVPERMIDRGGFRVATAAASHAANPWELLRGRPASGATPAFGDAETLEWVLKSGLGQVYQARAGDRPLPVRFVGAVSSSIFASELLVSEASFRAAFPAVSQPRYFLIETPRGKEDEVAAALRRNLAGQGVEVRTTREKLNALIGVQNAYLSAFLALGGLGLALGTLGLAAALARSAQARRKEFAAMSALGLTAGEISRTLVLEHTALLLTGLAWGAVAALLAVAPHLRSAEAAPNWAATGLMLALVGAVGLGGCAWAGRAALRGELAPALRSE